MNKENHPKKLKKLENYLQKVAKVKQNGLISYCQFISKIIMF